MSRVSWLDEETNLPNLDERVHQLEHFAASIADGVIDGDELDRQQENLVAAMRSVESELSDEQHEKVTKLLMELTAFNVMKVLRELAVERARRTFR